MPKTAAQVRPAAPRQAAAPATHQPHNKGIGSASPHSEHLTQLATLAAHSPQAQRLAQLSAAVDSSPRTAAPRALQHTARTGTPHNNIVPMQAKSTSNPAWQAIQAARDHTSAAPQWRAGASQRRAISTRYRPAAPGHALLQRVKRQNFTAEQRAKILAKNRKKYNGFYRCENEACRFEHKLLHFATFKGRRKGDGGFHVDHKQVASQGGRALIRNSRVLCGTCNTSRGNRGLNRIRKTGRVKYSNLHRGKTVRDYKVRRK